MCTTDPLLSLSVSVFVLYYYYPPAEQEEDLSSAANLALLSSSEKKVFFFFTDACNFNSANALNSYSSHVCSSPPPLSTLVVSVGGG